MLSQDLTSELNRIISSTSTEIAFLQPGRDEGVVPIYSLLGELIGIVVADQKMLVCLEAHLNQLGDLMDQGGLAHEGMIRTFSLLAEQLQEFVRYFDMGQCIEWSEFEVSGLAAAVVVEASQASPPFEAVAAVSVQATQDVLMVLDLEGSRDVLEEFYQEAEEHLISIEAALLDLEQDPDDPDAIRSMFRSFHTIKGVAGFLDLTPLRVLSHEIETLMDLMRSGKLESTHDLTGLIFDSRDRLQLLVQQIHVGLLDGKQPDKIIIVSDLILKAQAAINTVGQEGVAVVDSIQAVSAAGQKAAPVSSPSPAAPDAGASSAKAATGVANSGGAKKKMGASIRMDIDKLDSVIEAVGELVIVESQLRDSIIDMQASNDSRIERNLRQLSRITRDLQHSSLSLRMVSLKPMFQRMQRLARDVAAKSGKSVNFRVEGEETEMDRTVVEQIADPLVHMIRNSIDHGIELPEDRIQAGKNNMGEVLLKASYMGESIVLELKDDGKGINSEQVLAKAISRGLAQEGGTYSREEILQFLFLPGFSTAETVSDFSGRGVGMDVVRSNVQQLRGRIDFNSVEGAGSHVRISLPLTMAIIDGLLVRSGNERYVIPVSSINMTLKPSPDQIFSVQNRGKMIKHRDTLFSLMHLGKFFDIKTDVIEAADGIVIMIETDICDYGLIVDEILHKQEVVIKQLGSGSHPQGVSGGAILGDGLVALILDPSTMAESINRAKD
jgi:two-component system chemotaxis sensor kinase CheA